MKIISIRYCRKKYFRLNLTSYQPLTTYSMASHATYCILGTLIKTYHLAILFTLSQRIFNIKSYKWSNQSKISLIDGDGNEISSNFKISIVLHIV